MASISFEQVTKIYPDKTRAVNAVDLEVPDGSLTVLLGPSGCGKTTLLRMVAGLEEITSGAIAIDGKVVNRLSPKQRDIAMVFQNYALYPHMSVYDNMAFGLKVQRVAKSEMDRRVRAAAAILGLEDKLRNKPKNLSGGQRQRVAMGRAIVREPRVFLMDEPLSNLDAKLRVQMRAEIARVQRALGTTMLYVTHDQMEAMTLGDLVAVMRDGVLEQVGKPQSLYSRPANLFVAGFVGAPAMNMTEATVRRDGDGLAVEFAGRRLRLDSHLLDERPALTNYVDRVVMLGIRAEHMEDASLVRDAPADRIISATVTLREELGSETYVYLSLLRNRDDGADLPLTIEAAVDRLEFIARMNPETQVQEGAEVGVFVDTRKLHAFDLDTGDGIYTDSGPARAHLRAVVTDREPGASASAV